MIDHIGVGVPDLAAAKAYYDGLMPLLGFVEWFPADEHQVNYGPAGDPGTQLFLYRAEVPAGPQHLAFAVPDRATVDRVHAWAVTAGSEVVHAPRDFPEYGAHYATFFRDPHGFTLEVVAHA